LEPGREWLVGPQLRADLKFHEGQLTFEQLAALTKAASLVVTSSGFAAILGPAVGTPTLSIIGGYEDGRAHDSGMRFAPYLAIEPEQPCRCWSSACAQPCTRKLNMSKAALAIQNFIWRVTSEQTGKPLDIFREFPLPELADLFDPETLDRRHRSPLRSAGPRSRRRTPHQSPTLSSPAPDDARQRARSSLAPRRHRVKYKLHMAYANREDLAREAVASVQAIGNIHVWPNGDNPIGLGLPAHVAEEHWLPPMAPVSMINLS
jgi:hypothetical protein